MSFGWRMVLSHIPGGFSLLLWVKTMLVISTEAITVAHQLDLSRFAKVARLAADDDEAGWPTVVAPVSIVLG